MQDTKMKNKHSKNKSVKNGHSVKANGTHEWYKNNNLHREDGPARIWDNGTQEWYKHNKLHHEGGPARIYSNGLQEWWINGRKHRADGPAVIFSSEHEEWWLNGKRHRLDGPAVIKSGGIQDWYSNGKYLGRGAEGFWALWESLNEDLRENFELLKFFPGLPK
jgi:hypothetical protein